MCVCVCVCAKLHKHVSIWESFCELSNLQVALQCMESCRVYCEMIGSLTLNTDSEYMSEA